MKVKFEEIDQFLLFVARTQKLKGYLSELKGYSSGTIFFLGMEFTSISNFLEFLESNEIIEIIYKPLINLKTFSSGIQIFSNYTYELQSIILNTENIDALSSEETSRKIPDRLLTINEVSSILGITRQSLYKLINLGELNYFEILSQKKIKLSELNNFIFRQKRNKKV